MATSTRRTPASPVKTPESQVTGYMRRRQQAAGIPMLVLLGIMLWVGLPHVVPLIPAVIVGVRWKAMVAPAFDILWTQMPPADVPTYGIIPVATLFQWINWGLAAFGGFIALTLLQHLMSLYVQRTRPLAAARVYRLVRVPVSMTLKPTDGLTLLRQLHGMLPPPNVHQGTPAPLVLRWTARPERRVQQGLSIVAQGDLSTSIGKVIEGIASGTKVETKDDPLLAELQPGRWLCACDLTLTAPSDLPIAIGGDGNPLLESLLPALSPQSGVICADMQTIIEPVTDPSVKLRVKARLEQLKLDLSQSERKALEMKAQGPAFRCSVRLLVIGAQPDAAQTMLRTMSAAFAGTVQTTGTTEQRLRAGPITVLPAVLPERPPMPNLLWRSAWAVGVCVAVLLGVLVRQTPMLWSVAALSLCVPVLIAATVWRRKTKADMYDRHARLLKSVLPLRNPRCVPLWGAWLGRSDS